MVVMLRVVSRPAFPQCDVLGFEVRNTQQHWLEPLPLKTRSGAADGAAPTAEVSSYLGGRPCCLYASMASPELPESMICLN